MTTINSTNYDSTTGIYTKTFTWITTSTPTTTTYTANNTYVSIYQMTSSQSGSSSIEWVMLERGNQPSGWGLSADEVGGFNINNTSIYSGTYGSDSSVYISTANMASKSIAGRTGSDWRFTIGSNFGVTNTGATYASTLVIGPSNGYHATVTNSAFEVYNDSTLLSSFGTTT